MYMHTIGVIVLDVFFLLLLCFYIVHSCHVSIVLCHISVVSARILALLLELYEHNKLKQHATHQTGYKTHGEKT